VGMILGYKCRFRPSCILGIHERTANEPYGGGYFIMTPKNIYLPVRLIL
jgi:hypothetical protein